MLVLQQLRTPRATATARLRGDYCHGQVDVLFPPVLSVLEPLAGLRRKHTESILQVPFREVVGRRCSTSAIGNCFFAGFLHLGRRESALAFERIRYGTPDFLLLPTLIRFGIILPLLDVLFLWIPRH